MYNAPIIAKCCYCGQIRAGTRWQQEQSPSDHLAIYSHTYCPVCLQKAMLELDYISEEHANEMRKAS